MDNFESDSKMADGGKLSGSERGAVREVGKFFGSSNASVKGIDRALSNAGKGLGELQGSKPAFAGNNGQMAQARAGFGVELNRKNFFGASIGHQAFVLAHEAGHTSRIAPRDFGNTDGVVTVGPYGYTNAVTRASRWPSSTFSHPDTVPYAFGLRRPGEPDE